MSFQHRFKSQKANGYQGSRASQVSPELMRTFHTALVNSQSDQSKRNFSAELNQLTQSPAFLALINATEQLASIQGISEEQAAEELIAAFHQFTQIWQGYIFQEGLGYLKSHLPQ